jgi:hypothetical protein
MWLIFLEALGAGLLLVFIVWWTMFSGRPPTPPIEPAEPDAPDAPPAPSEGAPTAAAPGAAPPTQKSD